MKVINYTEMYHVGLKCCIAVYDSERRYLDTYTWDMFQQVKRWNKDTVEYRPIGDFNLRSKR